MSKAMEGILVECDAPIKAYLQHLDEKQQLDGSGKFIINADLDERHLLIKEAAVEMIQQKVEELQASSVELIATSTPRIVTNWRIIS